MPSPPLDTPSFDAILSRSSHGSFLSGRLLDTNLSTTDQTIYEATVSTIENPPQTAAWVFEPQLEQKRQSHLAQSPPSWPQAPDTRLVGAWLVGMHRLCVLGVRLGSSKAATLRGCAGKASVWRADACSAIGSNLNRVRAHDWV